VSEIFFISLGAILGANTRFKIHSKLENLNIRKDFLILIINTFASFSLGLFLATIEQLGSISYSYQLISFFSIGFLGSLSTFSSFVCDLFDLCLQLKFARALKLFLISLSFGIIAFTFGLLLGN
tara:strand:+ start:235 stop:606 length:372 start_codon:yes stop_codon:yes gene_type:complete